MKRSYDAFTLIEILVTVGLISILAAATILAINPSVAFSKSRNASRWNGVRAIHSGIEQWLIDGNDIDTLLEGDGSPIANCVDGTTVITDVPTILDGQIDLDAVLVGSDQAYIVEIPRDPSATSGGDTGYRICLFGQQSKRILISAPDSELEEVITIPTETPPELISDTIAVVVGSGTNDTSLLGGTSFNSTDTTLTLGTSFNNSIHLFLNFQNLDIPQGATITNATLDLVVTTVSGSNVNVDLMTYPDHDTSPPTNSTSFNSLESGLDEIVVDWNSVPSGGWGTPISSPDISALIQSHIDDPTWTPGSDILIWVGNDGSDAWSGISVTSGDFSGSEDKPTLSIDFEYYP